MRRVLLVEDSEDFRTLIEGVLAQVPCRALSVGTLAEARAALASGPIDLAILDIGLPDGSGYELCEAIRSMDELEGVSVIFVSGSAEIDDKVRAFSLGADDYLVKPFSGAELLARVRAKFRKLDAEATRRAVIRRGPITLDAALQKASLGGKDLDLTPIEFKILYLLARSPGKAFSREELTQVIWGSQIHVQDHNLYTHIYSLRRKLGAKSSLIDSVPREGYRFVT